MSFAQGRCACGACRFTMTDRPMTVHCCHCRQCQRETGSAFAVNALIEAEKVTLDSGRTATSRAPTASGAGQSVERCTSCLTALWSRYGGMGEAVLFVRVGTLEDPQTCAPDVHVHTATMRNGVGISPGVPRFEEFYTGRDVPAVYGEDGAARLRRVRG